jgi:CubicO group peptidase (beta-lactamase class C family)
MPVKKNIRSTLLLLSLLLLFFIGRFIYRATPIITGFGAKNLCSAVYLQHRQAADVIKEDLSDFPISLGTYSVNQKDSSVTGTILGFARQKAIYRKGAGATLVNDFTEQQIRDQGWIIPDAASISRDSIPWPDGDKLSDTLPPGIDQQAIHRVLQNIFKKPDPAKTRAFLIVYNGQIIAEKYADGFNRHMVMQGWSVSKSITAALTGILVKQGKLQVDAPAPLMEWKNNEKRAITLRHLLQQTAGIKYWENYASPSEATNMLFKKGDMAGYVSGLPLQYKPGTVFNYSSGNANIVSKIIRQTLGDTSYRSFPYTDLFHPIGMYSTIIEPDASGTYVGSSYIYASARDFARFGLLYYNNGKWNNNQLLPETWVSESLQSSSADKLKHYGYFFWLNGFDNNDHSKRWYPDAPEDMFFADGFGGQDIFIIPSKKLVVVRLGLHAIDENKLLKEIIAATSSSQK